MIQQLSKANKALRCTVLDSMPLSSGFFPHGLKTAAAASGIILIYQPAKQKTRKR